MAAKVLRYATKAHSVPVTAPPKQSYQLWNSSTVRLAAMSDAPRSGAIVSTIFQ